MHWKYHTQALEAGDSTFPRPDWLRANISRQTSHRQTSWLILVDL